MTSAEKKYHEIGLALAGSDDATVSQMFGMPALKINGKAFAGFWKASMVFKLTGEPHIRALAFPGAKLFEPMEGRPMKEWVVVPATSAHEWPRLAKSALDYCAKLKKK